MNNNVKKEIGDIQSTISIAAGKYLRLQRFEHRNKMYATALCVVLKKYGLTVPVTPQAKTAALNHYWHATDPAKKTLVEKARRLVKSTLGRDWAKLGAHELSAERASRNAIAHELMSDDELNRLLRSLPSRDTTTHDMLNDIRLLKVALGQLEQQRTRKRRRQ